ncbi:hypothetical protein GCM10023158_04400 [Gluconacetobacter tumulicola]|uniref:MobC family plasmid mobilization relaxosome protein n=3 Tax=Gluconacetobacter tumulicola TaxID=1017177 RepID=A0A7W4JF47_9PROT|nr:MobC family plasmid mobilization relaxosome protein [Gluconacetobacter tumulicola]
MKKGERRTVVTHLRLNPSEMTRIKQAAGSRKVASFLRQAALDVRAGGPHLHDDLVGIRAELRAIGNNLNQIAKRVNQGGDADGIATVTADIGSISKVLNRALARVG